MKTERLLLALAAITLAGCAQNEIIETAPKADRSIRFDVYTGVQTKGTETTTASIQGANVGFGILGYKTSSNWADDANVTPAMYNEKVTHDGAKWTYTNTRYWPTNGDKLSFFAYAPYVDAAEGCIALSPIEQTGAPEITFTQHADPDKLVDLVLAQTTNKTYDATLGADNKIGFTFNHVLTKIDVKAQQKDDYGDTKIVIKNLELLGASKLYKKATCKMSDGTWDYTTAGSKAEVWGNSAYSLDKILNKDNSAFCGYAAGQGKVLDKVAATVFSGTGANKHFLYMIPVRDGQTPAGLENAGDAKLKVTYDIVVKVTEFTHETSTTVKEVNLPAEAFKKGTFTTYTLKIGLNAIEIGNVTVSTSWDSGSDTNLDVK